MRYYIFLVFVFFFAVRAPATDDRTKFFPSILQHRLVELLSKAFGIKSCLFQERLVELLADSLLRSEVLLRLRQLDVVSSRAIFQHGIPFQLNVCKRDKSRKSDRVDRIDRAKFQR